MSELIADQPIQKLPLDAIHREMGGQLANFGGWRMPMHYEEGIISEHFHTRQQVSLFDCSHMGEFRVQGDHAGDDLDRLLPRRASTQKAGSCRYNFLLTEIGTIVDDLIVYKRSDTDFFIVVNAATTKTDADYFREHLSRETEFHDESSAWGKFDLQGPSSARILHDCGLTPAALPSYYHFTTINILDIPCLISRTGYTGELGYEIYHPIADSERLWRGLTELAPVQPAGLGARDTLRLEMGYPLYGHELSREITPVEAGWGGLIDFDHEFMGRENLRAESDKKLVGIQFDGRRAARLGTKLTSLTNEIIGEITSGSFAPTLQTAIALAYLSSEQAIASYKIQALAGRNMISGVIEPLPFYRHGSVRAKV